MYGMRAIEATKKKKDGQRTVQKETSGKREWEGDCLQSGWLSNGYTTMQPGIEGTRFWLHFNQTCPDTDARRAPSLAQDIIIF